MENKFDPNKLFPDDKDWLEIVNDSFDSYIDNWARQYRNGELLKEDIIKVTEKIAKLRDDSSLVNKIKERYLK